MAKVGADNEPLYERLMFGYDGTSYRVVKVDTAGNLVAAVLSTTSIQANSHGYIGAAWQKSPLGYGYSGDQTENVQELNLSAGSNTLNGTTVPAGEIWNLQAMAAKYTGTVPTRINLQVVVNGISITMKTVNSPASADWYSWDGFLTLSEGDNVRCFVAGATLNDDLRFNYHCVTIDIDQ